MRKIIFLFIVFVSLISFVIGTGYCAKSKKTRSSQTEVAEGSKQKKSTKKTKKSKGIGSKKEIKREDTERICTYSVKKGDTPAEVAKKFGVTLEELKKLNDVKGKKMVLVAGETIKVPCKEKSDKVVDTKYCQYKVRSRVESLTSIATRFDLDVSELAHINRVKESAKFKRGKVVKVPCEALKVTKVAASKKDEVTTEIKGAQREESKSMDDYCKYEVKKGDTLFSIAKSHNMTVDALLRINPSKKVDDRLVEGDILKVPCVVSMSKSEISDKTNNMTKKEEIRTKTAGRVFTSAKPVNEERVLVSETFNLYGVRYISPVKNPRVALLVNNRLDIPVEKGEKIYAVADGKVVYSTNNIAGVASLLVVRHGDIYSVYSGEGIFLKVKSGEAVKQGDVIGEVKEKTFLRFQIRNKEKPVDPEAYTKRSS